MAEFAELHTQEWEPIVSEINRLGLFSRAEIKKLVSNVHEKEYTMQKRTRTLDNVLDYVKFQTDLLDEIKTCREKLQVFEKFEEIEQAISRRINSLFGSYTRNFSNEIRFWEEKLKFVIEQKWFSAAFTTYQDAIIHLGTRYPYLYEKASAFEWSRNPIKHIDSARRLLTDGTRLNQQNLDMYAWRFELEMKHANMLSSNIDNKEELDSETLNKHNADIQNCLQASKLAFTGAIEFCLPQNGKVKLYERFLQIASKYQFEDQNEFILREMMKTCEDEVEYYGRLAEYSLAKGNFNGGLSELRKGIKMIDTLEMYDTAIAVLHKYPNAQGYEPLHSILQNGIQNDKLSPGSFFIWLDLCISCPFRKNGVGKTHMFSEDERMKVLKTAIEKYPDNLQFAIEMFKINATKGLPLEADIERINKTALPQDNVDDWMFPILMIHVETNPSKLMISCFQKFVNRSPKLFVKYLRYIHMKDGIEEVREAYKSSNKVNDYEVMSTMAEMEFKCLDHSLPSSEKYKRLRDIMEKACQLHGQANLEVWIDYIKYEKCLNNPEKVSEIFARALNSVPSNRKQELLLQRDRLIRA